MILSVSRRTDIPAFYMPWFMERVRAGFCRVPHPFRPSQVREVSLRAEHVHAIVFWTRHAAPLQPHVDELTGLGYRFYVLYTLLDYPPAFEPSALPLKRRLAAFRELAARLGPERVVWRYDPIIFSAATDARFHRETFSHLAETLRGSTRRCIVSLLTPYPKVMERLSPLTGSAFRVRSPTFRDLEELIPTLVKIARECGMGVTSCASQIDLRPYGVEPGACIDPQLLAQVCNLTESWPRDPGQRPACRCVASVDIGIYDTCPMGCRYCYATRHPDRAIARFRRHDPRAEALVPLEAEACALNTLTDRRFPHPRSREKDSAPRPDLCRCDAVEPKIRRTTAATPRPAGGEKDLRSIP